MESDFNQSSYMAYEDNAIYLWAVAAGMHQEGGTFPAQDHATFDRNYWTAAASGTNLNISSLAMPNPYTDAQLYTALTPTFSAITDEASFIAYVTTHPEAHVQRTALTLLQAGYALPA